MRRCTLYRYEDIWLTSSSIAEFFAQQTQFTVTGPPCESRYQGKGRHRASGFVRLEFTARVTRAECSRCGQRCGEDKH